jgi:integrase/recombinase XerD
MDRDLSGASNDAELMQLWLQGRPESTTRVYEPVAQAFMNALPQGLRGATVKDVLTYIQDHVKGEPATRARLVSTIKSLLSWAWRTGYTAVNVGKAIRCVRVPSTLHKKLLDEGQIQGLCKAASGRDHALVVLLYVSGLRISEACGLLGSDLRGCHVTVLGKGTKTRTVLIPKAVADLLQESLRIEPGKPLFCSRWGRRPLGVRAAREAIYKAASKVGLDDLSPHWLRHAHATHAMDRGAPLHVVQQGLGHASVATTSKYLHVKPSVGTSQWLASPV